MMTLGIVLIKESIPVDGLFTSGTFFGSIAAGRDLNATKI